MKKILIYLDTEKHANPFDLLLAQDAGFDDVIYYSNIKINSVERIVESVMFARGENGAKYTTFFISGNNIKNSIEIFEKVKSKMYDSYIISTILDPNGAFTTGAAGVIKIKEALKNAMQSGLKNKNAVVLAAGTVGQGFALILSKSECNVCITSRNEQKAKSISETLNKILGKNAITGIKASNDNEIYNACKNMDIIIATGPSGVIILKKETIEKLNGKIIADVNVMQPDIELKQNCCYLSGMSIGRFKIKVQKEILKRSIGNSKHYSYIDIFDIARQIK